MANPFKKTRPTAAVEDIENIVDDFSRRIPYWSYRALSYSEPVQTANLIPLLDGWLDRLFKGDVDEGNADILDNIIADAEKLALIELEKQRRFHADLNKSFGIRFESDRKRFEDELDKVEAELAKVEKVRDTIAARCESQRFTTRKEG